MQMLDSRRLRPNPRTPRMREGGAAAPGAREVTMTDQLSTRNVPADEAWSPRSTRLGGDREQEILRAAYELLAEVGYEGLRLDAVAARARTSKATLYRHWPGKPQLIADAVRVCKGADSPPPDTGSLRGDLVALMTVMAESVGGEDGAIFVGLVMAMYSDPEFAAEMRALQSSKQHITSEIHARAVRRGEARAGSDPHLIEEIAPALMFTHYFAEGRSLDEAFIAHLVDDILMPLLTR